MSPGDALRAALARRGWSQKDLAEILDRPVQVVSEIVTGKKEITAATALQLAAAFEGTTPWDWLWLEIGFQLAKARGSTLGLPAIRRRAKRKT